MPGDRFIYSRPDAGTRHPHNRLIHAQQGKPLIETVPRSRPPTGPARSSKLANHVESAAQQFDLPMTVKNPFRERSFPARGFFSRRM